MPHYGGNPSRLAVAGHSAGGNLTAATGARLAGNAACPRGLLLIYGVFDFSRIYEAIEHTAPSGVSAEAGKRMVRLMVGSYLSEEPPAETIAAPRVSPIHAAVLLPPVHIVVGSADTLVDQSASIAEALAAAGITHEYDVEQGMARRYVQMQLLWPTRPPIDRMAASLRKHL